MHIAQLRCNEPLDLRSHTDASQADQADTFEKLGATDCSVQVAAGRAGMHPTIMCCIWYCSTPHKATGECDQSKATQGFMRIRM